MWWSQRLSWQFRYFLIQTIFDNKTIAIKIFFFFKLLSLLDELTEKCLPDNESRIRGKCSAEQFQCLSGECIPLDTLCDGTKGKYESAKL